MKLIDTHNPPNKRDSLQSLPQAHLICQDTIDAIFIQTDHPVQTTDLHNGGKSQKVY